MHLQYFDFRKTLRAGIAWNVCLQPPEPIDNYYLGGGCKPPLHVKLIYILFVIISLILC